MAHVMIDIDGTAAAYPQQIQELASAMMCAGHRVSILTGCANSPVTQQDWDNKANYLNELGMGQSFNDMTVLYSGIAGGLDKAKAAWCASQGVDIAIDNSKANAAAMIVAGVACVLVPWATRV